MREEEIIRIFYTPGGELKDYYQVLEVSPESTLEEIKKQRRKLVKKWKNNEEMLKKLNEAYEVLTKYRELYEKERKLYEAKKENKAKKQLQEDQQREKEQVLNIKDIAENVKFSLRGIPELMWLSNISNEELPALAKSAEEFKDRFIKKAKQNKLFQNYTNSLSEESGDPKAGEKFFDLVSEEAKHIFNLVGWNSIYKHMSLNYVFNTLLNVYAKGIRANATNDTLIVIAQALNLHRLGTENKPVHFTLQQQVHMVRSFLREIEKIYRTAEKELGLTHAELIAFMNSNMGYKYFHSKIIKSENKNIQAIKEFLIEDDTFKMDVLREQVVKGESEIWENAGKKLLEKAQPVISLKNEKSKENQNNKHEPGLKALFLYEFWKVFDKTLEDFQQQVKLGVFASKFSAIRTTVVESTKTLVRERIEFYKKEVEKHAKHLLEDPEIAGFVKDCIQEILVEHRKKAILDERTLLGKSLSSFLKKMEHVEEKIEKNINNKPGLSIFKKAMEKIYNKKSSPTQNTTTATTRKETRIKS